ncbi:MAG: HEAT repeat domain-containing protein [Methylococcaceae bacterium]
MEDQLDADFLSCTEKLESLNERYLNAKNSDDLSIQLDFIDDLLSNNDEEIISYHYSLLKDKSDTRLFQYLRGDFKKREDAGKHFLLQKIKSETDFDLKAEALFILGTMKCAEAKPVAIQFLNEDKYDYQYKGIIVLGWLGGKEEVPLLENTLKNNKNSESRGYAASALRKIWHNNSRLKKKIFKVYYEILENEVDDDVNRTIISCTQDMLRKKFGIKESQYGEISGDVVIAKPKAIKALEKELS